MSEPNYYNLIGVEKNATLHEIRSKFRAKVLAEHPDKGGDPKTFQLLNKAYNILTDQEKRRRYDSTGRAEKSAEEEFVDGFGGGRLNFEPRPKDADDRAVVSLQDRIVSGVQTHEESFAEWMRQRDQSSMIVTDKDFMKTHLFNSTELTTKVNHPGPVQHVLGSPKTDAYGQAIGGQIQVVAKPRPLKKTIEHDEVLVRMLAVPVEQSMCYAELSKSGVCIGMSGVGRLEQVGTRVEDLNAEDAVLVMPKPTKFSSDRPIGTARTLLICNQEDVMRVPNEILEELTPEQICLTPIIVASYMLLELFGNKLKPGDSVLLNAAHLSGSGSALLQLCKLLKLKPLCMLSLPGAPSNIVKGEYGTKSAWEDLESRNAIPPSVRNQYERISEWLVTMGAEEVFPDAVALLRWRDRNQRMLPKLALDGICSKNSCEQLIHCLQPGDKDSQVVVYGHGMAQPVQVAPTLLSAWGGDIVGFSITRWVYQLSANTKKMMAVMENITKLVRSNKFLLDTVLYKVGEDAISDAFARAVDSSDNAQVVLLFPTLQEELTTASEEQRQERQKATLKKQEEEAQRAEDREREKLASEWLNLLFTRESVAAMSPEGPIPTVDVFGTKSSPRRLVVWLGDDEKKDQALLKKLPSEKGMEDACILHLSWPRHSASETMVEFNLNSPEVLDGSWYLRDKSGFENQDLDTLHDCEILGRALAGTIAPKLEELGLDWKDVSIFGFGKGAGIAAYASLLQLVPKPMGPMILFSPVVAFPAFLSSKLATMPKHNQNLSLYIAWSSKNKSTPGTYRQLLQQVLRKAPFVKCTPDNVADASHEFDSKGYGHLTSLVQMCFK